MNFTSTNPYNLEQIETYPHHSDSQISLIIESAQNSHMAWRGVKLHERTALLRNVAEQLDASLSEYAHLISLEMGKRLSESKAEVEKCAHLCRYYARETPGFLERQAVPMKGAHAYVSYRPLGVILGVMPWNYPFWQVFRFAIPALMAGNAALLKHARNVTGCALTIEKIFQDSGFPEGLFQTLVIPSNKVKQVIERREIAAVSCTGSTRTGKSVAKTAAEHLKKSVLELGGSDPYIILDDAPIEKSVELCEQSRFLNCGQSCISAKRFIVMNAVVKDFLECLVERVRKRAMGDPFLDSTTLAPMARPDLVESLHDQVERSIRSGARPLLGGTIPDQKGAFYPATILSSVKPGMPAFEEELFGPVASVIAAETEDVAVALANASNFGLGAAVFTTDKLRGERIANEALEAGCCCVNDFVRSHPELPFGGIKNSGYGRELSAFGLREFVNVKSLYVSDAA